MNDTRSGNFDSIDPGVLFESIFEGSGSGMVLFDTRGTIIRANRNFSRMSGYSPDELPGMNFLDFVFDENRQSSIELFSKLVEQTTTQYHTLRRYKKKSGEAMDVNLNITVVSDREGKAGFVIGIVEDISQSLRMEKARQVAFNISSAANSGKDLPGLIATIREELGKIIDTSNFFVALYNRESETLTLPYFADDKDHFETFPAGKTISAYVIKQGKPMLLKENDMNLLEKQGHIGLVGTSSKIWMGVPLRAREEIIGLIGIQSYTDEKAYNSDDLDMLEFISSQIGLAVDRKRTEDDLMRERVLFKQIFENSPEAIVIGDRKGNILNINKGFTQLFGFEKEESIGRNINDLITPEELIEESTRLRQQIGRNELFFLHTVRKNKSGNMLDVSVLGSPFEVNGQELTCVIYRDISDQKKTEEKLMEAKEKAEESDRLKTAFLANMSHEIRTPMNAIIGFTELLSVPNLPDEDKSDYISVIRSSGNILLKLIDDIIDLAKIEADQIKIEISRFPLNEAIKEVHAFYSEEVLNLERKQIDLLFEPGEPDDFVIVSDPFRLKQVLNNLVGNAIKFTEKGFVKIKYHRTGPDKVKFYVEDTGIGIPEDKHDLIFNRFLQVDYTGTRKYGGTGLGLTISKKLVELLGGQIGLESAPERGSTFHFTIRTEMTAPAPAENKAGNPGNEIQDLSGKMVLVVEDNTSNFQLIKEILRNTGAEILWAEDAHVAFELLRQYRGINLVLMDVQMPGMSGYEATRIIAEEYPGIPVIAQTAYAMSGEREKALEAGCADYISKPIKAGDLLSLIHKHLRNN